MPYHTIPDFFEYLPEDERLMALFLHDLVTSQIPGCKVKLAYQVPFYYVYARICFVWPASIPWGGIKQGVQIGFCRGHLLADESGYLEKGNRKTMYGKTFYTIDGIDTEVLQSLLDEAIEVDAMLYNKKSRK